MIFPKTQHLKLMMYASSLTGTWPYIFENNPALKKLYNNYFKVVLCCYISYTVCAMIKFFILVTKDDVNTTEVVTDLGIALINSIAILRLRVISGEGIKSIVREIINFEEKILQCSDEKIIKIYNVMVLVCPIN